jgi:hypothetical protein
MVLYDVAFNEPLGFDIEIFGFFQENLQVSRVLKFWV